MDITSLLFILLYVISVFIYFLLNQKYRAVFLTILSCGFIATYSTNLLLYILLFAFVNYYVGVRIPISRNKKMLYSVGIFFNLLQLVLLKYASFSISPVFRVFNISWDISILSTIIVPIGISYFTLQAIGYLVNINMGWEKPELNFFHFLLYIVFFPRFLAGPIDRSNHFLPQLKVRQDFNEHRITEGFRLVLLGMFKKIVIANYLAINLRIVYSNIDSITSYSLWIILFLQPLVLYFDFSAYTDIAVGIAKTFGIELRPNFLRPFLSSNMTAFWKRFHISLSSWFHDYVFMRTLFWARRWSRNSSIIALFITWILFGIWHGAGWNFLLLGLLQGIAIYYEFISKKWRARIFLSLPDFLGRWIGRVITYTFFSISLVLFFAPDLESGYIFFSRINTHNRVWPADMRAELVILVSAIFLMILEVIKNDYLNAYLKIEAFWNSNNPRIRLVRWGFYLGIIFIIKVFNAFDQEFLYYQF